MKTLEELKKEFEERKKIVNLYGQIVHYRPLKESEKVEYNDCKEKIISLEKTIRRLERGIPYTPEEQKILEEFDSDSWLKHLEECDFEKDTVIRILSMLKTDNLLPCFKSEGISLTEKQSKKAYSILSKKKYRCIEDTLGKVINGTIKKVKENKKLTKREIEIQNSCIEQDGDGKYYLNKNTLKMIQNECDKPLTKYKETHEKSYYGDWLLNRLLFAVYGQGILASGEKEFIASYFADDLED